MSEGEAAPVLEARHISRHFGAVVALADASLALRKHEVLGLVGDNGAGKSTLLKILSGVIAASSGDILIDGRPVQLRGAQDAMDAGIETVYQDLALVDTMTAYQNVYLGREELAANPVARFFNLVDDRQMRGRAREVLDSLAVKIPSINASVKGMSGGQRQCLAIARALLWGRRIVILDEPTAALGVRETEQVLEVIRDLRKHDVSVIVVSHNMQQLMSVADRITVMRLGRTIATRTVSETQVSEIVGLITGAIPGDDHEHSQRNAIPA
ncbi:MAG TPA: ATP-binding cassette domain-containing protein [Devosiaceae bacterium]|jgi:ABC-type sugar transport system ATPase subunit|nr:ATP-binding cassette domain-containing protein [Devosiaceae bacterium]